MGPLTRTALAVTLAAALAAGCDAEGEAPVPEPPRGTGTAATTERPHFRGHRPVILTQGRFVVTGEGCLADDAPEWVCDPHRDRPYLAFGDSRTADLVEARMDVAGGGTSWTVTARVARQDAGALRRLAALARGSGALVLVLDRTGDVLLPAAVTDIERGVISLSLLTKPEAWDLVERIAAG